jgi:hypothetical protein
MNLQDMAAVIEIVGGVLVLITLIFLVIQLRQNTNAIKSDIRLQLAHLLRDVHLRLAQDPGLGRVVDQAMRDPTELTHEDRMKWFWWNQSIMHGLEGYYNEARERSFPKDWQAMLEATIGGMVAHESIRIWWQSDENRFTRSFSEYVNGFLEQPPADHWNWLDPAVYEKKNVSKQD